MNYIKACIIENQKVAKKCYLLAFNDPAIAEQAIPGQFVHIRLTDKLDPLLRRPFSISHIDQQTNRVEILYRVKGQGTAMLSKMHNNRILDILGPVGSGFVFERIEEYPDIFIVAGGMGIAPMRFLMEYLIKKYRSSQPRVHVFLGAKAKEELIDIDRFLPGQITVSIATEDGSQGSSGTVVDLVQEKLTEKKTLLYACGPDGMLKAIARAVDMHPDITAYGSFESFMGCGLGMCWGCAIQTVDGYKRACKDGPVFELKDIVF